jgi:hypothetical protein
MRQWEPQLAVMTDERAAVPAAAGPGTAGA